MIDDLYYFPPSECTPRRVLEHSPALNHPTPSSSFYVLPDTPLHHLSNSKDIVNYDRPSMMPRVVDDDHVGDDDLQSPVLGFHRSYSPSSFYDERRATGNSDSSGPPPRCPSSNRRHSGSSQKIFPHVRC